MFVILVNRMSLSADVLSDTENFKLGLKSHLASTFHDFQRIDLNAKFDLHSLPKTFEIFAKSGDEEYEVEKI